MKKINSPIWEFLRGVLEKKFLEVVSTKKFILKGFCALVTLIFLHETYKSEQQYGSALELGNTTDESEQTKENIFIHV